MTLSRQDITAGFPVELENFRQFILELDDEQWQQPSRCDGWTVGDVAGHVVGTMADVAAGNLEGLGSPEVTEREVAERRGRSRVEIAEELEGVTKVAQDLMAAFPEEAWTAPAPGGYEGNLAQGIEALFYDTWLHADDMRAPLGLPSVKGGEGLRAAVHHVAYEAEKRGWGPLTVALDGVEELPIKGGGDKVTGDPFEFVLVGTGRKPAESGAFAGVPNIYAD